jgi:hypothetical protein
MGLTVSLIAAACVSPGCHAIEEKNHQANKTADMVLKLLAAEETDSLYENYTTEGFRRANSAETLRKLAKALKIYLGAPEKHSMAEFHLKTYNGEATGEYLYKVAWAKAEGTLRLKLQWQDGAWKIQTLDIQSPALQGGRNEKPVNTGETIHI